MKYLWQTFKMALSVLVQTDFSSIFPAIEAAFVKKLITTNSLDRFLRFFADKGFDSAGIRPGRLFYYLVDFL
jgi:adenine specific DNA methylase Mod